jgi:type IV pilus assembly protein PilC
MEKYKYRAINNKGRQMRGVLSALNENDLFSQLQAAGLELIDCSPLSKKSSKASFLSKGVKVRDLIQFFIHVNQLENAGVSLLDALADIRDTTDNMALRDAVSEIYRDVSEGSKLSEAMAKHPKIFSHLYIALIASSEETGKMSETYQQLIKYLKWVDEMQTRVRKATRYPMVLCVVVVGAVATMMGLVVPQIVEFIRNMDFELPFATTSLIATSDFFQQYWWIVIATPIVIISAVLGLRKGSDNIAYQIDKILLDLPVCGVLIRKINIARFCQTFGALYASGLPILQAISAATNTVGNRALVEALETIQAYVKTGSTLSQAFNGSGEFPSLVIRMLKVGEDSGKLTEVLDQVSEFYTKDVDEEVQKLIAMIEPSLTMVLGGMILWIAVGVFGPIYSSFENIDF